ncbi:pyridoxamine 5'-phosphate oxidase family protein [Brevibacillus gelatini]|uniref:Pyridoxamine 5'-phosphate oxidase family protein n=1 Tax=Brevibacillus gelatini TaxID=1655277 RepID=A0A3M8AYR7_9BACL|nr:pyridoxamine 5'-phosphate oxidase family protein [Brevibacillus gelatini]RNB55827.1 pyridoxamine 5'-phosphate oxidase family protein [Brevibacillus gelatini]
MSGFGIFREVVTSEEQLRETFGEPSRLVQNKAISQLDKHCRNYIAQSPFLIISTADEKGNCDASPRGDAPGFVHIIDDHHLVIPERPGNRRMDSITNILKNPHVGLIFLIPTLEETLRINGKACVIQDQDILQKMAVKGKVPALGIGVQVEECYVHCAKAFLRSGLWKPDTWPEAGTTPDIAKMVADHVNLPGISAKEVAAGLRDSYTNRLY